MKKKPDAILLPCPFCGGGNLYKFKKNIDSQKTAIYCDDCPSGMEDNRLTWEEMVRAWNTRKPFEELQGELSDLRSYLSEAIELRER
jgi:hypothetical protein